MHKRHIGFDIWVPDLEGVGRLGRKLLPSPGNALFTLLVVGALLLAGNVGALSLRLPLGEITTFPTMINFQGRLTDPAGQPIDGPTNMIFTLYEQASSGPPLWSEEWTEVNAVPVSNGLFNVLLGSQSGGIPFEVLSRDTLYLGITVPPDPEMTPRERLTSVPYALVAHSVPDLSITTAKIANQAITSRTIEVNAVDPSKLPNRQRQISLPIWSIRGEAEITEEASGMAFRIDHPSFGENGDFIANTVLPADLVGNGVTFQVTLKATAAGSFYGTSYVACQPADGTTSPFWNVDAGTQFSFVDAPVENQIYSFTFTRTSSALLPGCLLRLRLNFDNIPAGGPAYVYGVALLYEADN